MGLLHTGTLHHGLVVHHGVDQRDVRAHNGILTDNGMPLQEAARQNHRVTADLNVILDPRGLRVENVDAGAHPLLAHADVVCFGKCGKLHTVIHTLHA